ncbi:MAG TPA: response regulator transcription factor [Chloroflexota bacterium]|jgi:two-component system OmpR family response regulator
MTHPTRGEPPEPGEGAGGTILVVEDEDAIQDLVATALRFRGFAVATAASGHEALRAASTAAPLLIVLDVNLPDIDGFEVCRRLRAAGRDVPIVFLTARDDAADLRAGFTGGGDDYVTKPFRLEELLLRVEAVLRRARGQPAGAARLVCGDLVLDEAACRVWRRAIEVALSPTEFRLLRYLLLNQGRVVSKAQILDHVWDYDFDGDASAVETYVSYLRRKLDDREARLIRTVRGFGYSLRLPDADPDAAPGQ